MGTPWITTLRRIARSCAVACFCIAPASHAATLVSGPINTDTTWALAQSPFEVTGDVTVQNGATLTIEPGVVVYFDAATSLRIGLGALKARGTAAAPIVFTSVKERDSASPAPGDWGNLAILDGSFDATTIVERAQIRYGNGITVQAASPTLNDLVISDNAGPAISMDLRSSPTGKGLQAMNNVVNGIVVPAGDIQSTIAWRLRGIPFVVLQGTVSVGQSPAVTAVAPGEIQQGQTLDMTASGVRLDGAETVTFDNPGVTGTVQPGGTPTSIPIRVTATPTAPLGPVAIQVQVAAGTASAAAAFNVIAPKPPIVVDAISPTSIRRGETKTFQASGQLLQGATVTTLAPGLTISNIQTAATQVTFTLAASATATLGTATFVFANPAIANATASAQVDVLDALPVVSASPSPIAIPPDSSPRQFIIRISRVDTVAHSFNLSVADGTIASVSGATLTIPAGQTEVKATIVGLKAGQTSVIVTSPTLGKSVFPVFVTTDFAGINTAYASVVGVVLDAPAAPTPTTFSPIAASNVGVVVGSYIDSITPTAMAVGTGPTDLVISGAGLNTATAVAALQPDGLSFGTFVASPDGTTLTVPVTVAADAPLTLRQIRLTAGSVTIPAARPDADRLLVGVGMPEITSVQPIFFAANPLSQTLLIRGRNFRDFVKVDVTPADGISIDAFPTVTSDGTQITLQLGVSAAAQLGPRVVTVTTRIGTSSAVAVPANTFTIASQIKDTFPSIAAPVVGVVLDTVVTPTPQTTVTNAAQLGVTIGGIVTGITPTSAAINDTVTLTISGSELQGVTQVSLLQSTGVTVGAPTVAGDGKSLTVVLTIAGNAPQTFRAVQVLAGANPIPVASLAATQFLVTAPQPQVDSVTPLVLQVGQPLAPFTIAGKNFQNVQAVRVLPPDGITVGTPTANSSTSITVNIAAAATAALGPRVVVVDTLAGSSSSTASPSNTITLAGTAGTTFAPIVAPGLGVILDAPVAPVTTLIDPIFSVLGVVLDAVPQPPATQSLLVNGTQLGVALGPVATGVQPAGLLAGTSGTLIVSGSSLSAVTGVTITPAADITFGTPVVDGTGTQLSVPITAAAGAVEGYRAVVLTTAAGIVQFADPARSQFYIGTATPVFSSISPIVAAQGTGITLTIRGTGFRAATAATASPPDGIAIGAPSVDAAGTQVTVTLTIAPDAPLGARVIQVVTPVGTSSADAAPANTLTVISP